MSPSSSRAADEADPVARFMRRLARGPAPRPDSIDPMVLVRRAPLVARLARVRAGERRVVALSAVLELAILAGAGLIVVETVQGGAFAQLRVALGAGLEHLGIWGLPALTLIAAALLLATTTATAPSR